MAEVEALDAWVVAVAAFVVAVEASVLAAEADEAAAVLDDEALLSEVEALLAEVEAAEADDDADDAEDAAAVALAAEAVWLAVAAVADAAAAVATVPVVEIWMKADWDALYRKPVGIEAGISPSSMAVPSHCFNPLTPKLLRLIVAAPVAALSGSNQTLRPSTNPLGVYGKATT